MSEKKNWTLTLANPNLSEKIKLGAAGGLGVVTRQLVGKKNWSRILANKLRNTKEIQRGYKGNTRRAKRAAGKSGVFSQGLRKYKGDTQEIRGARSAPRKNYGYSSSESSKIQREYKGNTRRAKRAAENGFWGSASFRKCKGNTKGIRGARSAPRKIDFGVVFCFCRIYKGNTKVIRGLGLAST